MPMIRSLYPDDWESIARGVKERADWKCQACGKQCRKPGEPFDTHKNTLTVHHIDHCPENCSQDNLIALCAPCHLRADAELIDNFFDEPLDEKHGGLKYLAKSLELLDDADGVWMLKGWEYARECKLEHETAFAYGIPVYYLY